MIGTDNRKNTTERLPMLELPIMPVESKLSVLIAQENLRRAQKNQPKLTLRQIAAESGVSLSVLTGLTTNRSQRIDYRTIDKLCSFFDVGVGELLERITTQETEGDHS